MERQLTDTPYNERDADWSPDGRWIVFGSSASGNEDLWKIPSAGGQAVQLTSGPSEDLYPEWSPDGSRILFTSNRSGGSDNVWTMTVDGGDLRPVTEATDRVNNRRGHVASWSPDGSRIAFGSSRDRDRPGVWAIPAGGGTAAPMWKPEEGATDIFPAWSPDGTEVVITRDLDDARDLFVRHLETGEVRQLTSHPGTDWVPDWSPDGRWIAFSSNRSGGEGTRGVDIWVVAAAGGTPFNVTDTPDRGEFVPRWAPDSRQLVFNTVPFDWRVQTIDADGGSVRSIDIPDSLEWRRLVWGRTTDELILLCRDGAFRSLTLSTGEARALSDSVAWGSWGGYASISTSPDGRFLAYSADDPAGASQLFLLPLANGRPRQITASRRFRFGQEWSPDSRTLAFVGVTEGIVDIWRMPANGGTETRLTEGRGESIAPTWSPDGKEIAFVRVDSAGSRILVMSADGGTPRFLVDGDGPQWSPDGDHILYTPGAGFGASDLWRIRPDGGEPQLLHDVEGPLWGFQWSPDGSRILLLSSPPGNLFVADIGALLDAQAGATTR